MTLTHTMFTFDNEQLSAAILLFITLHQNKNDMINIFTSCAEENDGGRLFCYGSDIDLICVKMTVVNLMMNSVPSEVTWMNTLTMQHWRSYHIDLQLIAGVWLPILKITEAGDTSFIRKLENAMEDNSELKRSIQSNARATQLTFDF